jgi:hypothetical protein
VMDYAPPEPSRGRIWQIIVGAFIGFVFTVLVSTPLGYVTPSQFGKGILSLGIGFVVLGLISILGVVASMRHRKWIFAGLCIGCATTLLIEGACFTINAR